MIWLAAGELPSLVLCNALVRTLGNLLSCEVMLPVKCRTRTLTSEKVEKA